MQNCASDTFSSATNAAAKSSTLVRFFMMRIFSQYVRPDDLRVIANVGTIWERRGIRNQAGAPEADIVAFEAKYDVKLAPIVRCYFSELNGTKVGHMDEHLIMFWHLEQIRPMKEECPQFATTD